jgi:hypothetical protein
VQYFGLTFSDEKYIRTRQRYVAEMEATQVFSKVFSFGPQDLAAEFVRTHSEFIKNNPRGYGYWIWKPHIILKVLEMMNDGDILVYGDAGNEMKGSKDECLQCFNLVTNIKHKVRIVAARTHRIFPYVKMDLYFRFRFYGLIYAFCKMIEPGRIVIEKNDSTINFVKEWNELCQGDYRNIDDSRSILPDFPGFVEHRHDQSVFSLLFNFYKCKIVEFGDTWTASRLKF